MVRISRVSSVRRVRIRVRDRYNINIIPSSIVLYHQYGAVWSVRYIYLYDQSKHLRM